MHKGGGGGGGYSVQSGHSKNGNSLEIKSYYFEQ
jgi:hypothetical protein